MTFNLLMGYRPTERNEFKHFANLRQDRNGTWKYDGGIVKENFDRINIDTAIDFINKNSFFKHKIKILIDDDVYPNSDYFKKYTNIQFIKADKVNVDTPLVRMAAAYSAGIASVPDDDWLCFGYISDVICCKNWDKYIVDAIKKYGEKYAYVPMWIEIKNLPEYVDRVTPDLIWNKWREEICCHALSMPLPKKGFIEEGDLEKFAEIARAGKKGVIIEPCGKREYGYYAVTILKAKYAKKIGVRPMKGFDTDFDNRLWSILRFNKVIVIRSYVFHLHNTNYELTSPIFRR